MGELHQPHFADHVVVSVQQERRGWPGRSPAMTLNRKTPPKQKQPGLSTRPFKTQTQTRLRESSAGLRDRRGLADLLLDRALQLQRLRRQVVRLGLQDEGIEAAAVV